MWKNKNDGDIYLKKEKKFIVWNYTTIKKKTLRNEKKSFIR